MSEPIHVISLGAGVQSSAMALMAARGELTPMPECAIFADTKAEPASVYSWLDWLEKQLPFPIRRVSFGDLGIKALSVFTSKSNTKYTKHAVPAFIVDPAGKIGLMMRQCTSDAKLTVIHREIRRIIGRKRDARCVQWIGISRDEVSRIKDSRQQYIINRYPLVDDVKMTRVACLKWMRDRGYPTPPRSACVFCPYHSNKEWLRLKTQEPQEFARAAQFERDYQAALKSVPSIRGVPFLHRDCKPITEIDFTEPEETKDLFGDAFGNECEGMCGV